MSKPTPLYRNLVLDTAVREGCPSEVTDEAWSALEKQYEKEYGIDDGAAAEMLDCVPKDAFSTGVVFGYTAGRVARWDALVKGSPTLLSAIQQRVHEFFHDEPFGGHDGTADECTDCSTVSALAADAAAAFYQALPGTPDVYVEVEDEVLDDDEEIDRLSALAEQGYDETQLLPQVPGRALTTSVPDEWRKDA